MLFDGDVIAVSSHWTADGSRIVTDAVVATPTGPVVVRQAGGTVGELTMRTFEHGTAVQEPLVLGMRVAVTVHDAPDLRGRVHTVVDAVKVLAVPPGFVRTGLTKGNHYLYWESGCIFIGVADEGTKDLGGDTEFPIISAAIAEWDDKTAGCSYLRTIETGRLADHEAGNDRVNLIKFRDTSWCRPATDEEPPDCHPMSAAALTTATYVDSKTNARDGAIVDADIEMNAVNFDVGANGQTLGNQGCIADLANTLTHELGHLRGLEHTCRTAVDDERVDDQGRPVPLCSETSDPGIVEATMYNYQDCGETKKATLEQDDIDAICAIYPNSQDPGSCEAVGEDGGGCCSTGGRPGAVVPLAALVFLALRRRRR